MFVYALVNQNVIISLCNKFSIYLFFRSVNSVRIMLFNCYCINCFVWLWRKYRNPIGHIIQEEEEAAEAAERLKSRNCICFILTIFRKCELFSKFYQIMFEFTTTTKGRWMVLGRPNDLIVLPLFFRLLSLKATHFTGLCTCELWNRQFFEKHNEYPA